MTHLEIILAGAVAVLWVLGGHATLLGIVINSGVVTRTEAVIIWVLWPPVALWALVFRGKRLTERR